MAIDLGQLLDQLEEWVEAQVPDNLSELPHKMLETAERISNDVINSLTVYGPPSISIPFPPFNKEPPPPPPPPPSVACSAVNRASDFARRHPYAVAAGAAFAVAGTVGAVGMMTGVGVFGRYGHDWRLRRRFGDRGIVENGMLQEAVVILAPSPTPPLLVPLTATLLKAGYVVIVAVPHVKEAESLERRLSGLSEKTALRVLIYDTDDSTTFPAFHRSLLATLTLRFPATNVTSVTSQPLGGDGCPSSPHVLSYISLYPLHPNPPSQPGQLPALPTLIQPGTPPSLITLYPSSASTCTPETFATQVLATTHSLLASNLSAASGARVVTVHVGDISLPSLPAILSADRLSRRELARQRLQALASSSPSAAVSFLGDIVTGIWGSIAAKVGYIFGFSAARDYHAFEAHFLRILKGHRRTYYLGQGSISKRVTYHAVEKPKAKTPSKAKSASSSDTDAEDLASSVHTAATQSSSDTGLDGSWVVDS